MNKLEIEFTQELKKLNKSNKDLFHKEKSHMKGMNSR